LESFINSNPMLFLVSMNQENAIPTENSLYLVCSLLSLTSFILKAAFNKDVYNSSEVCDFNSDFLFFLSLLFFTFLFSPF
jgi:hypothetical protein